MQPPAAGVQLKSPYDMILHLSEREQNDGIHVISCDRVIYPTTAGVETSVGSYAYGFGRLVVKFES